MENIQHPSNRLKIHYFHIKEVALIRIDRSIKNCSNSKRKMPWRYWLLPRLRLHCTFSRTAVKVRATFLLCRIFYKFWKSPFHKSTRVHLVYVAWHFASMRALGAQSRGGVGISLALLSHLTLKVPWKKLTQVERAKVWQTISCGIKPASCNIWDCVPCFSKKQTRISEATSTKRNCGTLTFNWVCIRRHKFGYTCKPHLGMKVDLDAHLLGPT